MLKPDLVLSSILLVFLTVFLKQTKAFAYEGVCVCVCVCDKT